MATDKKISELPVLQGIGANDISVLVNNGVDYQFSIGLLLQFISTNINSGAVISFGTALPQNNTGKNGDVFINTANGSFAQKITGSWNIMYTIPAAAPGGSVFFYGLGLPDPTAGNNNDSYINTGTGIFYKKQNGTWGQVFSMQTGPQGQKGDKGDTGAQGIAGKSILSGPANPSNQTTGSDGDFYININTLKIFGPKTNGVWGTGVSITNTVPASYKYPFTSNDANPLVISNWANTYYPDYGNGEFLVQVIDGNGDVQDRPDISIKRVIDRSSGIAVQTAVSMDFPQRLNGQIIIKNSNIPIT